MYQIIALDIFLAEFVTMATVREKRVKRKLTSKLFCVVRYLANY